MKLKCFSNLICGLALLLTPWTLVSAQQPELNRFEDLVRQAVKNNKEFANADLESQKSVLEKAQVSGKRLPTISANAGYGYLNTTLDIDLPERTLPLTGTVLFDGSQRMRLSSQMAVGGLSATQVIFSGLQIKNGEKALEEKILAQRLLQEAGYDGLAEQVIRSADQLMLLKEVDVLVTGSEKRLKKEHQRVIRAIENGMAIPYDRDKIKLAMLELESKKAELNSHRELLYLQLEELTGVSADELGSLDYVLQEIVLQQDEANRLERKEIQALAASQRAYQYVLEKEKGARLPQVFAFGNLSYVNVLGAQVNLKEISGVGDVQLKSNHLRMAPNYAVGFGVRWTLFKGKTHKNAIEKAKLDLEINQNKLDDTQRKLTLMQRKNKADYQLAIKKLPVSAQQMIIAENNLHLASRQFQEGLIDITERLAAENDVFEQSLNYYQQIMAQRQAAVELLKTNGNLYQTIIK